MVQPFALHLRLWLRGCPRCNSRVLVGVYSLFNVKKHDNSKLLELKPWT